MARADEDARTAYEAELRSIIAGVADGLEGKPKVRREEATALLAIQVPKFLRTRTNPEETSHHRSYSGLN
jgi:hypothetical protein